MTFVAAPEGLLLERDRELERIRRRLRLAREGRGGALVVEGPAGIGKTVVLGAARHAAEASTPTPDRRGSVEYKREMARVLAVRALKQALQRAGGQ